MTGFIALFDTAREPTGSTSHINIDEVENTVPLLQ
jgi:hypothetical protein